MKEETVGQCKIHGETIYVLRTNGWRCRKCESDRVGATRRKHRLLLIEEAGGCCVICGYRRYYGALEFHHLDPSKKEFQLSGKGQTYSLARKRAEAVKCVLLCANCHAEVEAGVAALNHQSSGFESLARHQGTHRVSLKCV